MRDELVALLTEAGDPARASQQQRYMKSSMPFHGVAAPALRKITRRLFSEQPLANREDWERTVGTIWRRATHREQRYAAIALAEHRPYLGWLDADSVGLIEEMIITGAWWDLVDPLATHHMWHVFDGNRPLVRADLVRWASDDHIWRRRTAIIVQLKAKLDTDEDLLFGAIEASIDEREFFLRKAIGWALREYSKSRPDVVTAYVEANEHRLSGLSRREALRWLKARQRPNVSRTG